MSGRVRELAEELIDVLEASAARERLGVARAGALEEMALDLSEKLEAVLA